MTEAQFSISLIETLWALGAFWAAKHLQVHVGNGNDPRHNGLVPDLLTTAVSVAWPIVLALIVIFGAIGLMWKPKP